MMAIDTEVLGIEKLKLQVGTQLVMQNLNLHVKQGEIVAVSGPSGCGKTTLLRCIAGFHPVLSGRIHIGGNLVQETGGLNLEPSMRQVGIVFQDVALFPHLTVSRNIGFGIRKDSSRLQSLYLQQELVEMCELSGLLERYPHQLSGGQQQRVALCRALLAEPLLVLLDESFSGIDSALKQRLLPALKHYLVSRNLAALCVSHSTVDAELLADRHTRMENHTLVPVCMPAAPALV